jgi:hypothetical protein
MFGDDNVEVNSDTDQKNDRKVHKEPVMSSDDDMEKAMDAEGFA